MPCCTYLSDSDYTKPISDAELNTLLAEVREFTGEDWRVGESTYTLQRLFRKPKVVKRYTLYSWLQGCEFQVINFYRPTDPEGFTINIANDAGYVAAYLYGILSTAGRPSSREKS